MWRKYSAVWLTLYGAIGVYSVVMLTQKSEYFVVLLTQQSKYPVMLQYC
jgi:hypothetical protein